MRYADGNIELISKKQSSSEKLLMCNYCTAVWVDVVPDTFPLSHFPCEVCKTRGHVQMGMQRLGREE